MDVSPVKARLERAGISGQPAEWLLKALSPATPCGSNCQIPDSSSTFVATPEYVISTTVSAPSAATWDCLIIKTPTYPLLGYIVAAPAGTNFAGSEWQTVTNLVVHPILSEAVGTSIGTFTASYHSGNVNPAVGEAWGAVNLDTIIPSTLPLKWRCSARSCTEYLVANDMTNQGTVTSGQYPTRLTVYRPMAVQTASISGNPSAFCCEALTIPMDEGNMTTLNPRVRVAPAKMGVYQPLYNEGPVFPWAVSRPVTAGANDVDQLSASGSAAYNTYGPTIPSLFAFPQCALAGIASFVAPHSADQGIQESWAWLGSKLRETSGQFPANAPVTWGTSGEMTGVSLYRGLDATASLTVKFVLAMEIAPSAPSPVRSFINAPPPCEERVLQLYFDLIREMPQSYPASANSFGAVISAVSALLPMLLPHLPAIAGAVGSFIRARLPAEPSKIDERAYQPEMRTSAVTGIKAATGFVVKPRKRRVKVKRSSSVASKRSVRSRSARSRR